MKSTLSSANRQALRPQPDLRAFLQPDRLWVMGVVNVTPDSFYGASRVTSHTAAVEHALRLFSEGADILDIGGESTRPGSTEVSVTEELERVIPVIEELKSRAPEIPISVDTQKASVAEAALHAGADVINDVSALRHDATMAEVLAGTTAPVILMHMQGSPESMQRQPRYTDVVNEINSFFEERIGWATRAGIAEERLILDPGIGFGKTVSHNVTILQRLKEFTHFHRPILVGASRKSFLAQLLLAGKPLPSTSENQTLPPPEDRLEATLAAHLWAADHGASGFRVHDVAATRKTLTIWSQLRGAA